MSLLLLLRSAIAGSTYEGPVLNEGDRIDNGEPFIAVQIGQRSGVPLFLPYRGKCEDLVTDDVYAALQVGAYSSQQLEAFTSSVCDDGELPVDVPLVGVQVGAKSGLPLILTTCEACGGSCCFCKRGFGTYPDITITIESPAHATIAWPFNSGVSSPCRPGVGGLPALLEWGAWMFGRGRLYCSSGSWSVHYYQTSNFDPYAGGALISALQILFDYRYPPDPETFLTASNCSPFIRVYEGTYEVDPGGVPSASGFYSTTYAGSPVTVTFTET